MLGNHWATPHITIDAWLGLLGFPLSTLSSLIKVYVVSDI